MKNIADLIEMFCSTADNCTFYGHYSGRLMFGKTCAGIVVDGNIYDVIIKLCDFLHENGVKNIENVLGTVKYDELGMSSIIYFPQAVEKNAS